MHPELGLLLSFQEEGMPQPQYLGRSSDKDAKDDLVSKVPALPASSKDSIDKPSDGPEAPVDINNAFRQRMEAGLSATRKRSKVSKEKRRAVKIEKQREWVRSLKRAQCYLGLHPCCSDRTNDSYDSVHQSIQKEELARSLPPLALDMIAPFPFVDEPIFISIDVEWNERQRKQITEVGISTLDTLDIAHLAPRQGGKNWRQWIRSRHFRVKEYAHIVNCDFVTGCPDQFGFGKSEFVSLQDAGRVVESCFNPPYSAQIPVKFVNEESTDSKPKVTIETAIEGYKLHRRNVVLVGHDFQSDIDYLRNLGCNIFPYNDAIPQPQTSSQTLSSPTAQTLFLDTLDTAMMFLALKRDVHSRSLENILNSLGIHGRNLHNAGNDARFTLEAMVHMIINARLALDKGAQELSGDYMDWAARPVTNADTALHELAWQTEVERRVSEADATREAQIRDDCKIWEMVTGWDSEEGPTADDIDGGEPKGFMVMLK
ncbi:conserved hypothetical protein [Talaromyces stipitatus ATCC 10500]|uniref:Gfd2/YDR514C-like C-terminal domain-containing protein n=1 Tax=Talaromyces stipitatus (strain ATCC 10500 / CBS 375.48 / QM 6759 / NRRL 1006) TaxID=441959 RepID=B8M807_TALSN|nr:uncharacterized protein TSTA_032250 [Talaromyces stipitatus ATCC 10500]EED19969.1 conserved hypothetical protein [Talaromyces stipitatus ATCC 10500]